MSKPVQESVSRTALRIRGKAPEALRDAPELRRGLQFYYEAFFDLDSERSQGFGLGRIPWSAVIRYAAFYELTDDQTDRLVTHIRAMDLEYIKRLKKDSEDKAGSK